MISETILRPIFLFVLRVSFFFCASFFLQTVNAVCKSFAFQKTFLSVLPPAIRSSAVCMSSSRKNLLTSFLKAPFEGRKEKLISTELGGFVCLTRVIYRKCIIWKLILEQIGRFCLKLERENEENSLFYNLFVLLVILRFFGKCNTFCFWKRTKIVCFHLFASDLKGYESVRKMQDECNFEFFVLDWKLCSEALASCLFQV